LEASAEAAGGVGLGLTLDGLLGYLFPGVPATSTTPAVAGPAENIVSAQRFMGVSPVSGSVRVNLGARAFSTRSYEKRSTWREVFERNSTEGLQLLVNVDTFQITAPTRRCLLVSYNESLRKNFLSSKKIRLPESLIACSNTIQNRVYMEKYYTVTEACSESNGTTDCSADEQTRLRTMIRGESQYKAFVDMVQNKKLEVVFTPISSEKLMQSRMEWSALTDSIKTSQYFPGVLAAPAPSTAASQ
jgi:hypothetical protein